MLNDCFIHIDHGDCVEKYSFFLICFYVIAFNVMYMDI